ncbi:MAG: ATP-binding cassette domain-containing protein [Bernardetiaceae bacterium]|jgi:ABC-type multidrug transport system ATPase subunit|nr:ATP-binding cassette domain-containing protein [Bernardetiaceae bacterium]
MDVFTLILQANGTEINRVELWPGQPVEVGRGPDCALLATEDTYVSARHAQVELRADGQVWVTDQSTNGTFLVGQRLVKGRAAPWRPGQELRLLKEGRYQLQLVVTSVAAPPAAPEPPPAPLGRSLAIMDLPDAPPAGQTRLTVNQGAARDLASLLREKSLLKIGRDPQQCDVVLHDLAVSRLHATIERRADGQYQVHDYSLNGLYINGQKAPQTATLGPEDTLVIGSAVFKLNEAIHDLQDNRTTVSIRQVSKGFNPLNLNELVIDGINLDVRRGELLALMGPSGCGKTTLLKTLNGENHPLNAGQVLLFGRNLAQEFAYLRTRIGYVPQDDIVHGDLTVYQALYFAAQLRTPSDVTDAEINQRISEVLAQLNLPELDTGLFVKELSGGQRKRISIAVELLGNPGILLLDEPTSPLDPQTIGEFLTCLRNLARQGTTIIMVTHKPEDLQFVDQVAFLSVRGYLAYHGPPSEALFQHFGVAPSYVAVYAALSQPDRAAEWKQRWQQVSGQANGPAVAPARQTLGRATPQRRSQLKWLFLRYLRIKWNDQANLGLLLAQPYIIAALLVFVFDQLVIGVLFLMAISAVWFGVNNAAKEIVGEMPIYTRERMFNLSIVNYLASKVGVLALVSLLQVLIFMNIVYERYDAGPYNWRYALQLLSALPLAWLLGRDWLARWLAKRGAPTSTRARRRGQARATSLILAGIAGWQLLLAVYYSVFGLGQAQQVHLADYLALAGLMFGLAVSATLLGLLLSAWFKNPEQVMTFVPIVLIPQIMLAGVVTPIDSRLKDAVSYLTLSRWGTEALARVQDAHFRDPGHLSVQQLIKRRVDTVLVDDPVLGLPVPEPRVVESTYQRVAPLSLYQPVPQVDRSLWQVTGNDTLPKISQELDKTHRAGALQLLGFADPEKPLLRWFNSFGLNILALLLLNVVMSVATGFLLKRKDKLH